MIWNSRSNGPVPCTETCTVRRIPSAVERWTLYGEVGLRPDANGVCLIDYTLARLQQIGTAWLNSNFDRAKADDKLAAVSPTD